MGTKKLKQQAEMFMSLLAVAGQRPASADLPGVARAAEGFVEMVMQHLQDQEKRIQALESSARR